MQAVDEIPHSMEEKLPQKTIPAMTFTPEDSEISDESIQKQEMKQETKQVYSKEERKREKRRFLGRPTNDKIENHEEDEPVIQEGSQFDELISTYDGKLQLGWMQTDLDDMRERIKYCESPPISDYPEENMRIEEAVNDYRTKGVFRDGKKIKDYIESLMWFGNINPNLFGGGNYILKNTIDGYVQVFDDLMKLDGMMEGDEAIRLLSKLILIASRPLVIDRTLMKETEFEPSTGEGGVMAGTYDPDGDSLM